MEGLAPSDDVIEALKTPATDNPTPRITGAFTPHHRCGAHGPTGRMDACFFCAYNRRTCAITKHKEVKNGYPSVSDVLGSPVRHIQVLLPAYHRAAIAGSSKADSLPYRDLSRLCRCRQRS